MRIPYRIQIAILILSCVAGCGRRPESTAAHEKHYPLAGKVVALNSKDRTATIDASAIPNFMEAMTMEYPIRSSSDFDKLHVGDRIAGTVNVGEGGLYYLSNIRKQRSASK